MAAFDVQRSEPPVHRILTSVTLDVGYRIECECGWLSAVCDSGLAMFDAWAEHCIASERLPPD